MNRRKLIGLTDYPKSWRGLPFIALIVVIVAILIWWLS